MHEEYPARADVRHEYTHEKEYTSRPIEHDLGGVATREAFYLLGEVESPYEPVREYLESRVIDQPEVIDSIITALEKSSVRLPEDKRPRMSLALLGQTGTGKTETARALAEALALGSTSSNLIKIDCSAYSNGHEISNLLGSPPSYVGEDIKPLFSAANIHKPGTVVLFDEVEKAHVKLHQLMLQITDDGEIRLNKGEKVSFQNTVVLMTSNVGATEIAKATSGNEIGFSAGEERQVDMNRVGASARNAFKKRFSPEFVNRLDDLTVFRPLSEAALHRVLDVKLDALNRHYVDNFRARITLSQAARNHLVAQAAQEPLNGARPLVRALEKQVQAKFGRYQASEYVSDGTHIHVQHRDELGDEFAFMGDDLVFGARYDPTIIPYTGGAEVAISLPDMASEFPDYSQDLFRNPFAEIKQGILDRKP